MIYFKVLEQILINLVRIRLQRSSPVIAAITDTARVRNYTYDELERLTAVDVPSDAGQNEAYTLDGEGNRVTSHLSAMLRNEGLNAE